MKLISGHRLGANIVLLGLIVLLHVIFLVFAGDGYLEWTSFYQDITGDNSAPPINQSIFLFCLGCCIFVWILNMVFYFRYSGMKGIEFEAKDFWGQLAANVFVIVVLLIVFILAAAFVVTKIFIAPYINDYQITILSYGKAWVQYAFSFLIILVTSYLQLCIIPPNDARSVPVYSNSVFQEKRGGR